MYQSPIEIITKQMRTQFEDNVFKAIQDYGIVVDKEELIKALQYDRDQYAKGYADGMLARKDEWISVDEKLPKHREKVLVCDDRQNMFTALYVAYDNGGFDWCTSVRLVYKVTHWMPLPEAPKGGE